mgnify:FL=1
MYHSAPNSILIAVSGLLSLFNMGFSLYKFVLFIKVQSCVFKSVPHWCLILYFTASSCKCSFMTLTNVCINTDAFDISNSDVYDSRSQSLRIVEHSIS